MKFEKPEIESPRNSDPKTSATCPICGARFISGFELYAVYACGHTFKFYESFAKPSTDWVAKVRATVKALVKARTE